MKKLFLLAGCVCCLFLFGCGESKEEAEAWVDRGARYLDEGDLKNAEIYLKKAANSRHKYPRERAEINLETLETMKRTREKINRFWGSSN